MKKTLLALAVLTAGSANAGINLYDANGVKVDLSGAVEVQYNKAFEKDSDADIRLDDGDLAINASVAISDQLSVVTGTAFKYEKGAGKSKGINGDVKNDELWAGFSGDFGTLTFGRQVLIIDDAGIGMDVEAGYGLINFETTFDDVIKYTYDNGSFYAGLSHKVEDGDSNNDITDGRLGFRTAGLDARIYYADTFATKAWNLEAEYTLNNIVLAASYGQEDVKNTDAKHALIALAGSYTLDKTTFALGYNGSTFESDVLNAEADIDNVYFNVTQKLHSNVKVYAELGYADADGVDFDLAYTAGLEVKF